MIFNPRKILPLVAFFTAATCAQASLNSEEDAPQYSWKISTKAGVVQTIDREDGKKAINMGFMTCGTLSLSAQSFNGVPMLKPLKLSPSMNLEEATAALRASGLVD
tara:strand:- start:2283 stop:2600 length:318 start_codon:yes stop_codon:yes gene_type:complete